MTLIAAPVARSARTRIKICGLTREQDVDDAVRFGADAVGFVMYPGSDRCVTAQRATELARRLPPFVTPVLLFVNESAPKVIAACAYIPCAVAQFHGDESLQDCLDATQNGIRQFIRAARIPTDDKTPIFDLVKYAHIFSAAQAILLDAHIAAYGGGGTSFNWSLLPANVDCHLVLSGGLSPANVGEGIRLLRNCGRSLAVDVSSGVESSKGIKDRRLMELFINAVRAADASNV